MPWLDDGEQIGFLPNSIVEIINKKEGSNRLELDIQNKTEKTELQRGLDHTSYFRKSDYQSEPKKNISSNFSKKSKNVQNYMSNEEYRAISQAQMFIGMGDYRKALIELKPCWNSENAAQYIAECYEQLGEHAKAKEYKDIAKKSQKDKLNQYVSKAEVFMQKEYYLLALKEYEQAAFACPNCTEELTALKQTCLDKIKNQVENMYQEAIVCHKLKNFDKAVDLMKEIINAAQLIGENTSKYIDFNKQLLIDYKEYKLLKNLERAEELYNSAKDLYESKSSNLDYVIALLEQAIDLNSEKAYTDLLKTVTYKRDIEKYVSKIESYIDKKDYSNAKKRYNDAIKLYPNDETILSLKELYEESIISDIDYYYERALESKYAHEYESSISSIVYIKELAKIINKDLAEYNELENEVMIEYEDYKKHQKLLQAENFYQEARNMYEEQNPNYTQIIVLLKDALAIDDNEKYSSFLNIVRKDLYNAKMENFYNKAQEYFNNAQFELAQQYISDAMKHNPEDNKYAELADLIKGKKIDIRACTEQALTSLECIDTTLAQTINKKRKEGLMWYNYQDFGEQFGITPHMWTELEEKILFPRKHRAKFGRIIDF